MDDMGFIIQAGVVFGALCIVVYESLAFFGRQLRFYFRYIRRHLQRSRNYCLYTGPPTGTVVTIGSRQATIVGGEGSHTITIVEAQGGE